MIWNRAAAVCPLLVVLACSGKKTEPAPAGQAASGRILIGATLPLTGGDARPAAMYKQGYQLAVDEVNRRGGLDLPGGKTQVELIVRDDQTKPEGVTAQTTKLLEEDKVDFLLGSYTSALVRAGSDVAEKAHVPFVNGAGGVAELYQRNYRYLFGVQSPVDQMSISLMHWFAAVQKSGRLPRPARVALLWENTGYGKSFRQGLMDFRERADASGNWNVVFDEPFDLGTKNFAPVLARLKAARADVFVASIHLAEYLDLHQQYLAAGLCHKIESYGTRGKEKQYGNLFGPHGTDHLVSVSFFDSRVGNKAVGKAFADAFQAKYGTAPEWYHALGYETARVLLSAIERAGSADRERVREKLATAQFPSLLPGGQISFPAEYGQQARYLFVVHQNQPDGSTAIVFPHIAATDEGAVPNPRCARREQTRR